jgi:hypothetical protein
MNKALIISFISVICLSSTISTGDKKYLYNNVFSDTGISKTCLSNRDDSLFQDDRLPVIRELPDLFLLNDGSRVSTRSQWDTRRAELRELILRYEYGHLAPPSPVHVVTTGPDSLISSPDGSIRKREVILKTGPGGAIRFTVNLFIPAKVTKPYPVIIDGDLCWGSLLKRLTPAGLVPLVKQGYLIAEFDRTQFAPDEDTRTRGVFPLYPKYDWGALAAWAWGFHRTVDYLLTQEIVDKDKIIVTGWSRGGKACLLAGALDERIALVAPNCSGTCGSGPMRYVVPGAERIDDIVVRFPYWFNESFQKFTGENLYKLPFDQHSLIALVAPRAYLSTNGSLDRWADPEGTAKAHLAAREAWSALGAQDKMGIHYANSGHDHNMDKWIVLVYFADLVFYGKKPVYDYQSIPFKDLDRDFSWSAPAKLN